MTTVDSAVLAARLVLSWIVEPGNKQLYELVARHGPVAGLELVCAGQVPQRLAEAAAARLQGQDPGVVADALREEAERLGTRIVVPESPDWPSALDALATISVPNTGRINEDTYPPQALWLRGQLPLAELTERAVAIVGARASSRYGEHVAAELAHTLASRGWTVVSGGALGIDASAHRGALAADGDTVAVLACGIDRPYPQAHTSLFEQIADRGLLISEWPPGADPHKHRFLVRNRVIAALSRGTVMVEAGLRSGSRQTLKRTRQLGRMTMAVPGPVTAGGFAGCHEELRRDGEPKVRLVTCADHVIEEVGPIGELTGLTHGPMAANDGLNGVEQQLVDAAPRRGGAAAAELAAIAGVGLREALAVLPSLALRGYLQRSADGRYRLLT